MISKDVEDILEKIDNYLINDLKSLFDAEESVAGKGGACGYPMLQTLLSGIELLGRLTSAKDGKDAFIDFVDRYFPSEIVSHKDQLYVFGRNSVSHYFLLPYALFKDKLRRNKDLFIIQDDEPHLNVIYLYDEFVTAYDSFSDDVRKGSVDIEKGLGLLKKELGKKNTKVLEGIKKFDASSLRSVSSGIGTVSGASTSTRPYLPRDEISTSARPPKQ